MAQAAARRFGYAGQGNLLWKGGQPLRSVGSLGLSGFSLGRGTAENGPTCMSLHSFLATLERLLEDRRLLRGCANCRTCCSFLVSFLVPFNHQKQKFRGGLRRKYVGDQTNMNRRRPATGFLNMPYGTPPTRLDTIMFPQHTDVEGASTQHWPVMNSDYTVPCKTLSPKPPIPTTNWGSNPQTTNPRCRDGQDEVARIQAGIAEGLESLGTLSVVDGMVWGTRSQECNGNLGSRAKISFVYVRLVVAQGNNFGGPPVLQSTLRGSIPC